MVTQLGTKPDLLQKGFNKRTGFDFQDAFSPVVKFGTLHIVPSLSLTHKWWLRQVDVNNSFLHGDLSKEMCMIQPPGFEESLFDGSTLVCKLKKPYSGLKQASQPQFDKWKSFLLNSLDFKVSVVDSCMFIKSDNKFLVLLLVYVDDIVITGTSTSVVEGVISSIIAQFTLKDLGSLNYFLGIEVTSSYDYVGHIPTQGYQFTPAIDTCCQK